MRTGKTVLLCALAITLAGACRRVSVDVTGPADDGPQPVKLGTTLRKAVVTKSLGPLDDWNTKQNTYVYVIAREGKDAASKIDKLDFSEEFFIDNIPIQPPNPGTPEQVQEREVYQAKNKPYYYASDRRYEFFGYSVDDAYDDTEKNERGEPSPSIVGDRLVLPVHINGSQDILSAVTDRVKDNSLGINDNYLYGEYSARLKIVPGLVFQHQLSRFNLYVKLGENYGEIDPSDPPVELNRFQMESYSRASLVIANQTCNIQNGLGQWVSAGNGIDFDTCRDLRWLDLYCPPVEEGDPWKTISDMGGIIPSLSWNGSFVGTLMAMPGKSLYHCRLGFLQKNVSENPSVSEEYGDVEYSFDIDFSKLLPYSMDPKYGDDAGDTVVDTYAVPGHQYDVNVVLYSLKEVRISVSLTPWERGGSHIVDKDPFGDVKTLDLACDDIVLYPESSKSVPVKLMITDASDPANIVSVEADPSYYQGVEFTYEPSGDLVSVSPDGVVTSGTALGEDMLLITAIKYKQEPGGAIVSARGQKSVKVSVVKEPSADPDLVIMNASGVSIENGGTLQWNLASGDVINLIETHKGSGKLSSSISAQKDSSGDWADVLTRIGSTSFMVVTDVPVGGPAASAVITYKLGEDYAHGYKASPDYVINVEIINVP